MCGLVSGPLFLPSLPAQTFVHICHGADLPHSSPCLLVDTCGLIVALCWLNLHATRCLPLPGFVVLLVVGRS